jgi:GR25 family glycosyltransferase involved in LPS biosynthesis
MKLFERFDKVYCINLKKRPDRLNHFMEQVKKYDLGEFEVFEAVDGSTLKENPTRMLLGEVGIIMTTIKILETAISKNYKNILIIEDDCMFYDNVKEIDSYFEKLPKDWDMLYFGGNHQYYHDTNFPDIINENVLKLKNTLAAHCIAIKSNLFNVFLTELRKMETQSDCVYQRLQSKYNVYCFTPVVATQIPNYSNIQNHHVNYNHVLGR